VPLTLTAHDRPGAEEAVGGAKVNLQSLVGLLPPYNTHSGASRNAEDDPTVYAGAIGSFSVADPAAALAVVGKLESTAATNASGDTLFGQPTNYYEQNWVWFGLALAWGALPDLAS